MAICVALAQPAFAADIAYTEGEALVLPADYRARTFLTSSIDLSYNKPVPGAPAGLSLLDNVFVNPAAYTAYVATGRWPDGTIFVKENRRAEAAGTISRTGKYQTEVASIELHVKDEKRFPGKWAFFVSDGKTPAEYMPPSAACYACHSAHGAVDTTFVQFYPTMLAIAKTRGTLETAYLKESESLKRR
jgi:hypothetical protein